MVLDFQPVSREEVGGDASTTEKEIEFLASSNADKVNQQAFIQKDSSKLFSIDDINKRLDKIDKLIQQGRWSEASEEIEKLMKSITENSIFYTPKLEQTRDYLTQTLKNLQNLFIQPNLNPSQEQVKTPGSLDTRLYN